MSNNERYNKQFNDAMELIFDDPGRKSYPRTQNLMDALCVQIGGNGDIQDDGTPIKDGNTELDKMDDNFLYITLQSAIVTTEALHNYKGMLLRQIYKRLNKDEFELDILRQQLVKGLAEGMMKGEYCMHEIDTDAYKTHNVCPDCHKKINRPYKASLKE